VSGGIGSVLLPEQHASILHRDVDREVVIWTPHRDPQWRTRRASVAIELLAGEAGAEDVYLTVNQFYGRRQVRHLAALTALYVDVDVHGAPANLTSLLDQKLTVLQRARIPAPSLVVFSGRGLHLYWIIKPLPAAVLPRWQPCQRHLQQLLEGDPSAVDCTRLLRLVGSVNTRAPEHCRTVTGVLNSVSEFDFDWLAEQVLPRSRAEVRDIRAQQAKALTDRRRCAVKGKRTVYDWWMAVYKDLYTIVEHHWPQGVPEGQRDTIVFLIAVALSWFTTSEALEAEVVSVARRIAPTLSEKDVLSYTSSVRDRAARAASGEKDQWQGKSRDPRYHYKRETLYLMLKGLITPALGQKLFGIMSNEERDRRRTERERLRDRTVEGRHHSSHAEAEVRARASTLARDGHSVRSISTLLSVPRSTVADWLRSANTSRGLVGFARLT